MQKQSIPGFAICESSFIVYNSRVTSWSKLQWKLHDRTCEHTTAARKHAPMSAFGEQYSPLHCVEASLMSFKIISCHRDILHLHIKEAYAFWAH